jgi:hypothetical protein
MTEEILEIQDLPQDIVKRGDQEYKLRCPVDDTVS